MLFYSCLMIDVVKSLKIVYVSRNVVYCHCQNYLLTTTKKDYPIDISSI